MIVIRGPKSQSGFGVATLGLIKLSIAAGYDTRFIPVNTNKEQHEIGISKKDQELYESIELSTHPHEPISKFDEAILIDVGSLIYGLSIPKLEGVVKHILYCTTETTDIHPDYVKMMNEKYDEIWTASSFNKVGFASSGVTNKINILYHTIDTNQFNPDVEPLKIKNKKGFTFLVNIDFSYRKGMHLLLPAWFKAFKKEDDVCLLMKITNNAFNNTNRSAATVNDLLFQMDYKKDGDTAPMLFMTQMLDNKYIPNLYATADCYVSPNLGEGFGLPIAESMSCGVAPIVSRCGGPLDFVNRKSGLFIPLHDQQPTQPIGDPSLLSRDPRYRGRNIYNIQIEKLVDQLKYAYENQDEIKAKGLVARERIIKRLSIDSLVPKLKGFLDV